MSRKHRIKSQSEIEKVMYIKREFDEATMMLALINYLISKEEYEPQNFDGVHNENVIEKQDKVPLIKNKPSRAEKTILQNSNKKYTQAVKNKQYNEVYKNYVLSITSKTLLLSESTNKSHLIIPTLKEIINYSSLKGEKILQNLNDIHKNYVSSITSKTLLLSEGTDKIPLVTYEPVKIEVHKVLLEPQIRISLLLVFINHLNSIKESLSHKTNNKHIEEVVNKQLKYNYKKYASSITSETVPFSMNMAKTPLVTDKPVIIKVPIVLAEPQIIIPIQNTFNLDDNVLEIKRIKKNVYLSECKLLPNSEVLFISGFIRKSIEYACLEGKENSNLSGKIKNTKVKIPFNCTTKIKFITRPICSNNVTEQEVESVNDCNEESFMFNESFDEKISFELVNSQIIETEVIKYPIKEHSKIIKSPTGSNINEKSVLYLTINILQKQKVVVS